MVSLTKFFSIKRFFRVFLSLLLRSLFALPSLQGREDNIGFRGIGIKQIYVFAACRAGYRSGDSANFMRGWRKPDASMERGWCGLGAEKVCLVLV